MSALRLLTTSDGRRMLSQRIAGRLRLRSADTGRAPRVWGRPVIEASDLHVGDDLILFSRLRTSRIAGDGRIEIGDRVFLNDGVTITARESVEIGSDVIVAEDVRIMDNPGHGMEGQPVQIAPVRIGSGSWVGVRATVLPGVTIGERSIVAAGSVVTSDVPPGTLAAGVPARVVRELDLPADARTAWNGH